MMTSSSLQHFEDDVIMTSLHVTSSLQHFEDDVIMTSLHDDIIFTAAMKMMSSCTLDSTLLNISVGSKRPCYSAWFRSKCK